MFNLYRKKPKSKEPKAKRAKVEKAKKDKDPNKPKRPPTAFFVFLYVYFPIHSFAALKNICWGFVLMFKISVAGMSLEKLLRRKILIQRMLKG